jgi:hypothetical protein
MRHTALAIAAMLSVLASDVRAQGTKQYTGPLYPTNVAPYPTGTTPATPNWRANSYGYGYGYGVTPLRRVYPAQRVR